MIALPLMLVGIQAQALASNASRPCACGGRFGYGGCVAGSQEVIAAVGLTKSYGKHRGIVDVSLRVDQGEILGLVGANGAGKTTFMRTLLDFIRPTAGSLSVFGMSTTSESVAVRRRCSYLPGELVLPPRLSGQQVISRFSFARRDLDYRVVSGLADRLNIDLTRRVGELSKGNKQKVGLVLAFAPQADLLVLDEPTSGLDPLLQRTFAALVAESVAKGATVLLSSHVMSEVEQIADRVALMRAGRVVITDSVAQLHAKARRHLSIRPAAVADCPTIAGRIRPIAGVSDTEILAGLVTCTLTGDLDPLLKELARFHIYSLDVNRADLEDAFFSAYDHVRDSES